MVDPSVRADISGGSVGVIASHVHIENWYSSSPPSAATDPKDISRVTVCPYPGLSYFGPNDSALFFGRESAIERLVVAVQRHPFTAIVGASGSGKSSLALAGLAPRLHSEGSWRFTHFRLGIEPSKNPFLAFARAITPLLNDKSAVDQLAEVQKLAAGIEDGTITTANILGACRAHNPGKRILVIADQFEELFTFVTNEEIRARFIAALLTGFVETQAVGSPDVSLLITLRADFYGTALQYHPLPQVLQARVENLGPMTRNELREAIVRPAGSVRFESGLVETLLDDVEIRPGGLPLLQFALREMWARQQRSCITRASYEAIGGVDGAVAQRAEAIFSSLTKAKEDQEQVLLFRRLFTRLVALGEGTEDTRRVVDRRELGSSAWALAQRLAGEDNRLIVTTSNANDHDTAEVVHEALIRNWPTLIEWISRDRAFQSWLRQLRARLVDWRMDSEGEDALLRGGPLIIAEDWLSRRREELNDDERIYIEESISLRSRLARKEQETRERELQAIEQRASAVRFRKLRNRLLIIAVLALTLSAVTGGVYAYSSFRNQDQLARTSTLNFATLASNYETNLLWQSNRIVHSLSGRPMAIAAVSGRPQEPECANLLETMINPYPAYAVAVLRDLAGNPVCQSDPRADAPNAAGTDWFETVVDTGHDTIGGYSYSERMQEGVIVYAGPVANDQNMVMGVLSLTIRLEWLSAIGQEPGLPSDVMVYLLDRTGHLLVAPRAEGVDSRAGLPDSDIVGEVVGGRLRTFDSTGQDGVQRNYAVNIIGDNELFVLLGQPFDRLIQPVRSLFLTQIGVLVVVWVTATAVTAILGGILVSKKS